MHSLSHVLNPNTGLNLECYEQNKIKIYVPFVQRTCKETSFYMIKMVHDYFNAMNANIAINFQLGQQKSKCLVH